MFNLPEVAPYRLARAPLAQALVQVRHPVLAHLGTVAGVARLQDVLREKLPYMEPSSSALAVQLGPTGAVVEQGPPDGWQLSDDDGHRLVLSPGSVNLAIGEGYAGVKEFAKVLDFSLSALASTERIGKCDRLGVRYVSVVTPEPNDKMAWKKWFKPEVTGWPATSVLGARLDAVANRVQITGQVDGEFSDFPAAPQGLITSGWFPKGAIISGLPPIVLSEASFVIDFDFFVESPQPFDSATLIQQFLLLHSQMDRFFHWSLTEEGAQHFGEEER